MKQILELSDRKLKIHIIYMLEPLIGKVNHIQNQLGDFRRVMERIIKILREIIGKKSPVTEKNAFKDSSVE